MVLHGGETSSITMNFPNLITANQKCEEKHFLWVSGAQQVGRPTYRVQTSICLSERGEGCTLQILQNVKTAETPIKCWDSVWKLYNPFEFSRKAYGKFRDSEGAEFAYFCCDSPHCNACGTCSSGLTQDVSLLNPSNHLLPRAPILQPKLAVAPLLQVEQMSLPCFAWSPAAALFYFGSRCLSGKKHDPDFVRFKWGISLLTWTAHRQMVNDLFFYGYPGKWNLSLKDRSSGLFLACLIQHLSIAVPMLARQYGHQGCDVPCVPCAGKPPFPRSKSAIPRHHRGKSFHWLKPWPLQNKPIKSTHRFALTECISRGICCADRCLKKKNTSLARCADTHLVCETTARQNKSIWCGGNFVSLTQSQNS